MRFQILFHHQAAVAIAVTLLTTSPLTESATPSFLCSKAKSWVEKTVCSSDRLSELDMSLATEYARMLKVVTGDAEKTLNLEQRKWWAERGTCLKQSDPGTCLEKR